MARVSCNKKVIRYFNESSLSAVWCSEARLEGLTDLGGLCLFQDFTEKRRSRPKTYGRGQWHLKGQVDQGGEVGG